jgi:thiol-disulfide isomerase/thioredoxin
MITLRAVLVSAILSSCPTLSSAVEVGAPIPACDLKNFTDGQAVSLAQPGKVVYVDFWASWCGPCGQSMPFLNELHEQLNAKGLAVVGVNLDENKADAEAFLGNHPVKFPIATNPDGKCPETFEVQAMPSSFLIDRHGKVRHVQLGFHSSETQEIRKKVQSLLNEK